MAGSGSRAAMDAHDWMKILKSLPIDSASLRAGTRDSKPSIKSVGSGTSKTFKVTGLLNRSGQLLLPGATFRMTDKSKLSSWFSDIDDPGDKSPEKNSHAFGLDAKSLVSLTEKLQSPVEQKTKGSSVREAFEEIRDACDITVVTSSKAKSKIFAVSSDEVVGDELSGLSVGTSLAALVRPLGLVVVPQRSAGSSVTRLAIKDVRSAEETWPVGWPSETKPHKLVPKLHEFLPVAINNVPIGDALASIQSRLEIPFLFDHNGMARKQIDPATKLVSYPSKKTFYSRILKNILFQAKLKSEMRIDEAGKPFLWIYPR